MDALKEMFNAPFYTLLAGELKKVYKGFDAEGFKREVTAGIGELSLNQRMRNTSVVLKKYLPGDFDKELDILMSVIPHTRGGYTNLLFPDYVSVHGLKHVDSSLEALKYFTQFGSSEFAIRVFLKQDFKHTIKLMYKWAQDKNHHVRRLASEGSRPRLPWSFKLDEVISNPAVTQPILETLKADKELYVRKSVANHLNDISKENADFMLKLVNVWDKTNAHTAWIVKHASRTLIKKGHSGSLSLFDFEKNAKVKIENFAFNKTKLKLGDTFQFEFDLVSEKSKSQKLVVDYIIHYRKKSGELSPKVFKLKEVNLEGGQKIHIEKKQVIKDFTTRKHEAGLHVLEIQVNGVKMAKKEFELIIKK